MKKRQPSGSDSVHDKSYARLFSHPRMMEDLLRGFVTEDWIKQLDFSTLEKVNATYVSEKKLKKRSDDIVWKICWGQEFLYIYILLEFQTDIDPLMAVRILVYLGLLYQDLIDSKQLTTDGKLPQVLPIVLYRGSRRWQAPKEISDLVVPRSAGLDKYCPQLQYLLLDEGRYYSQSQLAPLLLRKNVVAAVFQLEHCRTEREFVEWVKRVTQWLSSPRQARLKKDLTAWVKNVLVAKHLLSPEAIQEINQLEELTTMLSERIDEWEARWVAVGEARGLEKGRTEGQVQLLIRLLEEKFGPLKTRVQTQISALDEPQVLECVKRLFTANTVQEVLGRRARKTSRPEKSGNLSA